MESIYNNGVLNYELAGEWTSEGHPNQIQDINTDNIYFKNTAVASYSNRIFWLNKNIDLLQYNNLVIEWKTLDRKMCVFGVTPNIPHFTNVCDDNEGKEQFSKYIFGTVTDYKTIEKVDILDIDSGYISFYLFDVKSYVYRIYLEK